MSDGEGIAGHQGASGETRQIKLGDHEYTLTEQPIGRMRRKFGPLFTVFQQSGGEASEAASVEPEMLYDALRVFIPDLMPLWRFLGFGSEEELRGSDTEDEEGADARDARTPSIPQLTLAIEGIYAVNGGEKLVSFLGKFVNLDVLRKRINLELTTRALPASPSSPTTNGVSGQTSSSMDEPTPGLTGPSA